MYKVIGWGIPSIPILIWSILMHQSNPIHEELRSDDVISSMCWISDVGIWIDWLRRGPILFILAPFIIILVQAESPSKQSYRANNATPDGQSKTTEPNTQHYRARQSTERAKPPTRQNYRASNATQTLKSVTQFVLNHP